MKLRTLLFLFFVFGLTMKSQAAIKTTQQLTDTTVSAKLQASRQLFWDSLPKPTGWTNDYEEIFNDNEEQQLDSVISAFEKETSAQICIVTLDTISTSKEKFDALALHIANVWGVGQKDKNNGVTICISKGHRRIRICNGLGIEKILSDKDTKEIIENDFIPKFKEGEYFQGTFNGLVALVNTLRQKLNLK